MSSIGDWLADRRPEAPDDLRSRVVERGNRARAPGKGEGEGAARSGRSAAGVSPAQRADVLLAAAREALAGAIARPGRVRQSAFELLVADALITYACEAALESERPVEALERLVEVGRGA